MKKHIFLRGAPALGKSELINSVLGDKLAYAGGFITKDILNNGENKGAILLPAAAGAGIEGFEGQQFLFKGPGKAYTDNEVFRNEGVRLLKEAAFYPFVLMDAFGGFEMIIPQFREALLDVLSSDIPCVGVLLVKEREEQLRKELGLGIKLKLYCDKLYEALNNHPDTAIIDIKDENDPIAGNILIQWAGEYINL